MNILLLKAWLRENGPGLIGANVRGAVQQGPRSCLLELTLDSRAQAVLLVSALEEYPALALLDNADTLPENSATESNFVKALNFHIAGYRISSITQYGYDRSVLFALEHVDKYGKKTRKVLRHELPGRSANTFLISERDMLVSMFKAVRRDQSRVRQIITGKPLPDPPPLGKFVAADGSVDDLAGELSSMAVKVGLERQDSLKEFFTRSVAGVDVKLWPLLEPLLPVDYDLGAVHQFIRELQRGDYTAQLFGFTAKRRANDVALELWRKASSKRGKGKAGKPDAQRERLGARLDQLHEQRMLSERADEVEHLALELLKESSVEQRELSDGERLAQWQAANPEWAEQVSLGKSLYDNAQELNQYAQRLRRGEDKLKRLIVETEAELARLERTPVKGRQPQRKKADPLAAHQSKLAKQGVKHLRFVSSDGLHIVVGVNDRSNDGLIRVFGHGKHLWLHARDYPGSHVIVLSKAEDVPQRTLEEAAVIAAHYSKGSGEADVDVSYLPVRLLRRPKNAKPGQVLLTDEKVVAVRPRQFAALKDKLRYAE